MDAPSAHLRYRPSARALHWGIALIVIVAIALIELTDLFPKGSAGRDGLKHWHAQLGLAILGLTALRLVLRLGRATPAIVPAPQPWEAAAAKLMHVALYAVMLALPVLGIAMLQASGKPVDFLRMSLPVFFAQNEDLGHSLEEAHELLGNIAIGLIGLHVAAALWHHFVRHDNTLRRMLPTAAD